MLLVALYSAMGILQAGSIYVGERASQNLRFWGAIMVLSLIGSAFTGFYIKRVIRPMLNFKSFRSAGCVLAGIELMHMSRKGQFATDGADTMPR
jgi:Ni,Fe-hydrogenase I cytochrome b subunit